MDMTWLLVATGFMGAVTLIFWWQSVVRWLYPPPSQSVHFSPKGGCTEQVVAEIGHARREILVLAYSFSSKPITEALIAARDRGVHIQVVLDKSNEQDSFSTLPTLTAKGIPTLIDHTHAIAHNKVMLIDNHTIVTGSFNFTHQAEVENAENMLLIKNHPELVKTYRKDFEGHKAHSVAPGTKVVPAPHHRAA
jgi:phosphatidylserine/phosphatidylglycerophosphate/cardiolipin synthase-like enzyme